AAPAMAQGTASETTLAPARARTATRLISVRADLRVSKWAKIPAGAAANRRPAGATHKESESAGRAIPWGQRKNWRTLCLSLDRAAGDAERVEMWARIIAVIEFPQAEKPGANSQQQIRSRA